MSRMEPEIIDIDAGRIEEVLDRAKELLPPEDFEVLEAVVGSYERLLELLREKKISIERLRRLLFGATTEKRDKGGGKATEGASTPDGNQDQEATATGSGPEGSEASPEEASEDSNKKGHGRNGAEQYTGAQVIEVKHESLQPGDPCPECKRGTVYESRPGVLVRITGQAPLQAKVYRLQKLRCNICGKVFTAKTPEEAGARKYDETVAAMIALLKYGSGMPFNRVAGLQGNLGIPLPASTQWEIVHGQARRLNPVYEEFIRQTAQGEVLYNDDTGIKILDRMGLRAQKAAEAGLRAEGQLEASADRKGLFTSGIVSTGDGPRIALFFSGPTHAGEDLAEVLRRRAEELGPPIQMCDALPRNLPGELETIVAGCLAHGRRRFVEVENYFPAECEHVLDALGEVYHNDAMARQQGMSAEERLAFHQAHSGPVMEALHEWLKRQLDERLVEPNSPLGQAIQYLLKHWEKLTLFLRVPGAPLDNNICERALKKAILHRKNALFYKSDNGAAVGDLYMSLIYTCQLSGVNPFDYLVELDRHADEAAAAPHEWMPWNYHETLERLNATTAAAAAAN